MIDNKQVTLALATIPAAAFLSGYAFNFSYLGSFDAALFPILTFQDYIAASLRWTSLTAAVAGVPFYLMLKETFPSFQRAIDGKSRVSETIRRTFVVPLHTTVVLLFLALLMMFWDLEGLSRIDRALTIATAFVFSGISMVLVGLSAVLRSGVVPKSVSQATFVTGLVTIPFGALLLWGGLTASKVASCKSATHLIVLEGEPSQRVVTLQFVDRGLIGYRPTDRATILIPWSRIKRVQRLGNDCSVAETNPNP